MDWNILNHLKSSYIILNPINPPKIPRNPHKKSTTKSPCVIFRSLRGEQGNLAEPHPKAHEGAAWHGKLIGFFGQMMGKWWSTSGWNGSVSPCFPITLVIYIYISSIIQYYNSSNGMGTNISYEKAKSCGMAEDPPMVCRVFFSAMNWWWLSEKKLVWNVILYISIYYI